MAAGGAQECDIRENFFYDIHIKKLSHGIKFKQLTMLHNRAPVKGNEARKESPIIRFSVINVFP